MRLFLTCWLLFSCFLSKAQVWNQLADFTGTARDDASTFTINNKVYCGLGLDAGFSCTSDIKVFDLATETWSDGVNLPSGEERQYANGFTYQGNGFIFGGINGAADYLSDLWKFNPVNNSWSSLPDLPSTGRAGAVCFVLVETFYCVGGKTDGGIISNEVWAFDLVNEVWFQKGNLPFDGIWRGISFTWNNSGIIGLGKLNNGNLNTGCYQYSTSSDSWQSITQLNLTPATYSMFSQIGNYGFVYGGVLGDLSYSNQFIRIDLDTWETTTLNPFPAEARRGGLGFVGNTDFYISTGVSALARLNETWKASSVLGLNDENSLNGMRIYPNPVKNELSIQAAFPIEMLEIYTISGNLIERIQINATFIEIPLQLYNGYYLVKLKSETAEVVKRICVSNE
jgi:hypothetical protein